MVIYSVKYYLIIFLYQPQNQFTLNQIHNLNHSPDISWEYFNNNTRLHIENYAHKNRYSSKKENHSSSIWDQCYHKGHHTTYQKHHSWNKNSIEKNLKLTLSGLKYFMHHGFMLGVKYKFLISWVLVSIHVIGLYQ